MNPEENNRALRLSGLGPNKKNPEENNRALRLSGLGPNNKNNKRSRFNRVLAPSVLGP